MVVTQYAGMEEGRVVVCADMEGWQCLQVCVCGGPGRQWLH